MLKSINLFIILIFSLFTIKGFSQGELGWTKEKIITARGSDFHLLDYENGTTAFQYIWKSTTPGDYLDITSYMFDRKGICTMVFKQYKRKYLTIILKMMKSLETDSHYKNLGNMNWYNKNGNEYWTLQLKEDIFYLYYTHEKPPYIK